MLFLIFLFVLCLYPFCLVVGRNNNPPSSDLSGGRERGCYRNVATPTSLSRNPPSSDLSGGRERLYAEGEEVVLFRYNPARHR